MQASSKTSSKLGNKKLAFHQATNKRQAADVTHDKSNKQASKLGTANNQTNK
jgi:hypothetical protein